MFARKVLFFTPLSPFFLLFKRKSDLLSRGSSVLSHRSVDGPNRTENRSRLRPHCCLHMYLQKLSHCPTPNNIISTSASEHPMCKLLIMFCVIVTLKSAQPLFVTKIIAGGGVGSIYVVCLLGRISEAALGPDGFLRCLPRGGRP